jgi:maleate isomerase
MVFLVYGWRGRIGLIVPSSNTTMESEFWKAVPSGVSIHVSRGFQVITTAEGLRTLHEEAVHEVRKLATAEVDVIVFGCTTGSLLEGVEWERSLRENLEKVSNTKVITTSQAIVEAFKVLGAKKLVVATPYVEDLNIREKKFLEDNGFKVLSIKGLGIIKNTEIGKQPPWVAYRLALEVAQGSDADLVFISCTNFRTFEVIEPLESKLGVPVVSSNTASLWLALRTIGIRDKLPYGRLLREF